MEIIRDYSDILETMSPSYTSHPIEAVLGRLVIKGIVTKDAARNFLMEIR